MLHGVDISVYQSTMPTGEDFEILKATEALGYVDAPFVQRWRALKARGTLRGAYHFAHPANGAVAEADHFLSVVRGAGLAPGDLLVLDHETRGNSASADAAYAREWSAHVEAQTGHSAVVYTYISFAEEGRCAGLGNQPLWIADPNGDPGHPFVPSPWSLWSLHQYSSAGNLDRDVFNGTADQWRALGGVKPTPTPAVEEDDMFGELKDGNTEPTILTWPAGKVGAIGFGSDNGYQQLPAAKLRVAAHSHAGGWSQIADEVVDSSKGKTVVIFTAKDVDMVSVSRLDAGTVAVGWDAS